MLPQRARRTDAHHPYDVPEDITPEIETFSAGVQSVAIDTLEQERLTSR
jgi:hypothetical protein